MNLSEIFPPKGHVQRLYCAGCKSNLDLVFKDFHENVSGVDIHIKGLPFLRCEACNEDYLPDHSRFAIIEHHRLACARGDKSVQVTRRKPNENFGFTNVPFLYNSDDYRYFPGLERPFNVGFLTPIFFNKEVLIKYDASPDSHVTFASPTYGEISGEGFSISFGINKNGKVLMWLGDIAKLPENEQYYLRSQNVASDHAIGSEFYDGQIECIFTQKPRESQLFALRSEFVDACFVKFGTKIAHLDSEVVSLASTFNPPVIDTEKERRYVADTLNKIYIESFDNAALGSILRNHGGDPKNLGSLKRLQAVLEAAGINGDIPSFLSPFFTLYDLRVGYSHLTSADKAREILKAVTGRLGLAERSGLLPIYDRLLQGLINSFGKLIQSIKG